MTELVTPERMLKFYWNYARRKNVDFELLDDVAQEMYCLALENEKRSDIPVYCQTKKFLFFRAFNKLFSRFKKESPQDCFDEHFTNPIVVYRDTSSCGRRFLREYRVGCNGEEVRLNAFEIMELLSWSSNKSQLNVVQSLKKHPHNFWLSDNRLYKSKRDFAYSNGLMNSYKRNSSSIPGMAVMVKINEP